MTHTHTRSIALALLCVLANVAVACIPAPSTAPPVPTTSSTVGTSIPGKTPELTPAAPTARLTATISPAPAATPLLIVIKLSDFVFEPSELSAQVGQPVVLDLQNRGTFQHNILISDLGVDTELLMPGQSVRVQFVPSRAGNFFFFCSGTVPSNHLDAGMTGRLRVTAAP